VEIEDEYTNTKEDILHGRNTGFPVSTLLRLLYLVHTWMKR